MTPNPIPLFVNGRPFRASPSATLSQLLGDQAPELLADILGGASVTDARGLPVDPDGRIHAGAIYRVQRSARTTESTDA